MATDKEDKQTITELLFFIQYLLLIVLPPVHGCLPIIFGAFTLRIVHMWIYHTPSFCHTKRTNLCQHHFLEACLGVITACS